MEQLPKDPVMMMSVVNTKLRDFYPTLDAMCEDMNIDRRELESQLHAAGFDYLPAVNQFR